MFTDGWLTDTKAQYRGYNTQLQDLRKADEQYGNQMGYALESFNRTMAPANKQLIDNNNNTISAVQNNDQQAAERLQTIGASANTDLQNLNTDNANGYAENWFNPMAQAMMDQSKRQIEGSAGASLFGTGTMQKISDQTALQAGQFWNDAIRAGQTQAGMNADNIRSGADIQTQNITAGHDMIDSGQRFGSTVRQQNFENTGAVAGQNLQTQGDIAGTRLNNATEIANVHGQRESQNNSWFSGIV